MGWPKYWPRRVKRSRKLLDDSMDKTASRKAPEILRLGPGRNAVLVRSRNSASRKVDRNGSTGHPANASTDPETRVQTRSRRFEPRPRAWRRSRSVPKTLLVVGETTQTNGRRHEEVGAEETLDRTKVWSREKEKEESRIFHVRSAAGRRRRGLIRLTNVTDTYRVSLLLYLRDWDLISHSCRNSC